MTIEGTDSNWVRDEGWVPTQVCTFVLFPGSLSYFEPEETCAEEAVPGTEFCTEHTEDPADPEDADDQADENVYGSFGACYDFYTGDSRG